jgi:hypothetical protein
MTALCPMCKHAFARDVPAGTHPDVYGIVCGHCAVDEDSQCEECCGECGRCDYC